MLVLSRRGFLVAAAATTLSACSTTTMPPMAPADSSPEALTPESILRQVNAVRAANGSPAWSWSPQLAEAARSQAQLMAAKDKLSHDLGVTLRQRVTDAGYVGAVGENVAGGQKSLQQAMEGWLASPGHRETLLSSKFVEFGLAFARTPGKSRMGIYWALIAGGSFDAWRVYG